jgi:O-antigen ligase
MKNKICEYLFGFGMGIGFVTTMRIWGPIGLSEILIMMGVFVLIARKPYGGLIFNNKLEGVLRLYYLVIGFVILPVVTFVAFYLVNINGSEPMYIAAFCLGILLLLWFSNAVASNEIDMKLLTFVFAVSFVIANLYYIFGAGQIGDVFDGRYTGGAANPNQLTFYASTLSLLLVAFAGRWAYVFLPQVIFLTILSRSDSYLLSMGITCISYLLFKISFWRKGNFEIKLTILLLAISLVVVFVLFIFHEELYQVWLIADEGDGRTNLVRHGLASVFASPLFGWGAGSFSGLHGPFQGYEAHNTFVDFASQFGIIFPLSMYGIMVAAMLILLRERKFFLASFVLAYIESGLFHFSGRHFVFWVEMAVLMGYVFPSVKNKFKNNLNVNSR